MASSTKLQPVAVVVALAKDAVPPRHSLWKTDVAIRPKRICCSPREGGVFRSEHAHYC